MIPSGASSPPIPSRPAAPLLAVKAIYLEPRVREYARGREILARYPDAELIEVPSHWNIAGLHGNAGLVADWVRVKREVLVLGVRKTLAMRANGRSADFIAPGLASGCAMACAYCYVPRHKGYANPITTFVNIEQTLAFLRRHAEGQGPKAEPNTVDPSSWVYDVSENSDLSVDALISDNVRDVVELYRELPHAKASFATKYVNRELLSYDPRGRTRVRFSLMPQRVARVVDVRTTTMNERVAAIDDFVEAGYEVHLNFSPVILYSGWQQDYAELFDIVRGAIGPQARAQLAAEVIFLTHHQGLHEVNLGWHPGAEQLLWQPGVQEQKRSEHGSLNVRYKSGFKGRQVEAFRTLLAAHLPECRVRYAF